MAASGFSRRIVSRGGTESLLLRTLIVDADPASRKLLAGILSAYPATHQLRECANGLDALAVLRGFKPHLLVCEVETPGLDGFAILEAVPPRHRPATIFLSRDGRFAARAFEVSAADYLVKPIDSERFLKGLERARYQMDAAAGGFSGVPPRSARQLHIRSGRSVIFIKTEDLDWAEAEGKHVRIHMGKELLLLKMSISALEKELDPAQFVRIHRSTIINIDRVRRVQPWNHRRTYQVTLQDGTRLVLSRKARLLTDGEKVITALSEVATVL